jgi:hypothetical protein
MTRSNGALLMAFTALGALATGGCSKDESPKTSATASATAQASAAPTPAPAPSDTAPAPAPSATAAPPADCPKGSSGEGSFGKPCEAKGSARTMEVTWTGKMDDKGPSFRVVNKSPKTILFGRLAVYFYDKAGKQLHAKDTSSTPPKDMPYHSCSGNMFGGPMKPNEKATITFSCVRKEDVPTGATAIEAELQVAGFTDETEKKTAFYWRNTDITPDVRKKGGVNK